MFARRNVPIDMLRGLTMLLMVFPMFLFVILVAVIITHIRIVNTLSSLNYKIVYSL